MARIAIRIFVAKIPYTNHPSRISKEWKIRMSCDSARISEEKPVPRLQVEAI